MLLVFLICVYTRTSARGDPETVKRNENPDTVKKTEKPRDGKKKLKKT